MHLNKCNRALADFRLTMLEEIGRKCCPKNWDNETFAKPEAANLSLKSRLEKQRSLVFCLDLNKF